MSKIRIHQGSRDLYVNVISVNSRYVDFIIHNDLSIDMKVPVGMSWEMIERYVRLNETMIFEEYEKKKKIHKNLLKNTVNYDKISGDLVVRQRLPGVIQFAARKNAVRSPFWRPHRVFCHFVIRPTNVFFLFFICS